MNFHTVNEVNDVEDAVTSLLRTAETVHLLNENK